MLKKNMLKFSLKFKNPFHNHLTKLQIFSNKKLFTDFIKKDSKEKNSEINQIEKISNF